MPNILAGPKVKPTKKKKGQGFPPMTDSVDVEVSDGGRSSAVDDNGTVAGYGHVTSRRAEYFWNGSVGRIESRGYHYKEPSPLPPTRKIVIGPCSGSFLVHQFWDAPGVAGAEAAQHVPEGCGEGEGNGANCALISSGYKLIFIINKNYKLRNLDWKQDRKTHF
jgi:hypothetical protein